MKSSQILMAETDFNLGVEVSSVVLFTESNTEFNSAQDVINSVVHNNDNIFFIHSPNV